MVGLFRPPHSVIPNLFRNLFSLLSSLLWILKQVQDDGLLGSVEAFTVGPFRPPHSVIPNLVRNLFPFTRVPPTDPETSSG